VPRSTPFLLKQEAQKKRLGEKKMPCKELSLAAASEEPPRLQRASFLKKARPKIADTFGGVCALTCAQAAKFASGGFPARHPRVSVCAYK
ncbi:MAG: hypothetical protein J6D21_12005, partial [Clostridia bacterium]|nr:hypothetical protein [Clostridia bacterium]